MEIFWDKLNEFDHIKKDLINAKISDTAVIKMPYLTKWILKITAEK